MTEVKIMLKKEISFKKKIIYREPIPKKVQRTVRTRPKNGEVKKFTDIEILLYELENMFNNPFKF